MHHGCPHKYRRQLLAVSLGYLSHYCLISVLVGVGDSSCFSNKEEVVTRGLLMRNHRRPAAVGGGQDPRPILCRVSPLIAGLLSAGWKGQAQGVKAPFTLIANN